MAILGYIVQYADEEEYTVYHGARRLFRVFSQAVENANELYRSYLESHAENYDGPFQIHKPTKKDCDSAGSVVIFESRQLIVWIDSVIE